MVFPLSDDNSRRESQPIVVGLLVLANVAVWLLQLADPNLTAMFGAVPFEILNNQDLVEPARVAFGGGSVVIPQAPGPTPIQLTLFTSMFLHGSWVHLLGNMLYLWIFADQIEDHFGHLRFVLFYVACGLAAAMTQVLFDPASVVPMVGASGAISGVLGAYLLKHPHNRVRVFFLRVLTDMPAFLVLLTWIGFQVATQMLASGQEGVGGVATMAHIGGFVAGLILALVLPGRSRAGRLRRRTGLLP